MAITWKVVGSRIDPTGILSLSVQEVVDSVDGKIYSAKINKNRAGWKNSLLTLLKNKIKADRAIESEKKTIESGIDLSGFEISINTKFL